MFFVLSFLVPLKGSAAETSLFGSTMGEVLLDPELLPWDRRKTVSLSVELECKFQITVVVKDQPSSQHLGNQTLGSGLPPLLQGQRALWRMFQVKTKSNNSLIFIGRYQTSASQSSSGLAVLMQHKQEVFSLLIFHFNWLPFVFRCIVRSKLLQQRYAFALFRSAS